MLGQLKDTKNELILLKIRDETVISCKFNGYHTGMERLTETDMSERQVF